MTHVSALDTTLQKTNEWLRDIGEGLGIDDRQTEYAALRATLQTIRDHLSTDEVAQLGAQMPMAVRGIYYEGWDPKTYVARPRNKAEFLDAVRRRVKGHEELANVGKTVRVALGVLSKHISAGEITQVINSLPADIRELWTPSS